jgi:ribosomal protein S18 acetylase RimI-like enzyme
MKSELVIRPARSCDTRPAVSLLHQAVGRLGDFFFGNGDPTRTLDILERLIARKDNRFSYNFTFLAEKAGQVVGLLLAYPAGIISSLELSTGRHLFPILGWNGLLNLAIRSLPLAGCLEAEQGEYYISALSVLPRFQGQGVGRQLMHFAEQEAVRQDMHKCSLIVSLENEGARRLYLHHGYQVVKTKLFSRWLSRSGESGYQRMVKSL